jgi:hypothetical protein
MNKQQLFLQRKAPGLWTAINNKNLWFVRSTEIYNPGTQKQLAFDSRERYVNMTSVLDRKEIFEIPERALFNQSINLLVLPFTGINTWDCRRYIFVAPMSEFVGELVGGTHQDYLTVGSHRYTEESYLLVPNDEVEKIKIDFPNLKSTIVGYNYPKTLLGEEGVKCLNKLKDGIDTGLETPRMAVENLFDKISKEKGINIWRFPKEEQYTEFGLQPKIHPTNSGKNEWSFRVDDKGKRINIDSLLEQFHALFAADQFSLEVLCEKINKIKNDLRRNVTTKSDNFISDYTDYTDENEAKSCERIQSNYTRIYAFDITIWLESFETIFDDPYRFSSDAKRYLIAIYDKSSNIVNYLEILHKYKKVHPENIDYINSYVFGKPNNKLVDILLSLLNKKEIQPLRKIIVSLSNAISGVCLSFEPTYNTVEINDLVARFNTKMDQITELLHTEVEYLKKRNSTLKNPAIRKKVNNSVRRVQAQLKGGFKQTRRNRVKKTRRM